MISDSKTAPPLERKPSTRTSACRCLTQRTTPGDERAVPGIRVDVVSGSIVSSSPVTPASHGVSGSVAAGGCQPVSTTETSTPFPSSARRLGAGDDDVSGRLLRLRRRATARRGHPDHLVGRGDAHAEHAVKPVEHHEHVVTSAELEAGDAVDEPVGDPPGDHRVVVTRLVELLGHARQVIVADQDVLTAVQVGEVGLRPRSAPGATATSSRASTMILTWPLIRSRRPSSSRVARLSMRAGQGELPRSFGPVRPRCR